MFGLCLKKATRLSISIFIWIGLATVVSSAQPVYSRPAQPTPTPFREVTIKPNGGLPTPTPLITNTSTVTPTNAPIQPIGGILVETLDGKQVMENYSNYTFNPASNVKVATAYAVLKTYGPNHRFPTAVWTDGVVDNLTGVLNGNLYIFGNDPAFQLENSIEIAESLNKIGVRSVNGDVVVNDRFILGYGNSNKRSAEYLFSALDSTKRSSATVRAWQSFLVAAGKFNQAQLNPSVSVSGGLYIDSNKPSNTKLLFTHVSPPLKEIVKITLCYSNNILSERLGDTVGGPSAVAGIVQRDTGALPNEFYLQTSSGLGINRVTPKSQMKLLRTLRNFLQQYKMTFGDIMPISQLDPGTLERRGGLYRGSVVGKTGTLGQTDGGVSSLSGEMKTKNGTLLFVIFNQKGGVNGYRRYQDSLVTAIQNQYGGAMPFGYAIVPVSTRMANTNTIFPNATTNGNGTTRLRIQ